jgi:hypothetical protein
MDKAEFLELYAEVVAMPEAENPALYQRSRRCFERLHKLREQGWASKIATTFSPLLWSAAPIAPRGSYATRMSFWPFWTSTKSADRQQPLSFPEDNLPAGRRMPEVEWSSKSSRRCSMS